MNIATEIQRRPHMKLKKGFLIAIEGIDGAGKTTQANLLYKYLKQRGARVVLSKEPTDSIYGQKIKRLAQGERDLTKPNEEYHLFMSDRRVHVENLVKPALNKNNIVILDRYYFSTIAYQGAIGIDSEEIKEANEAFAPIPEIVFLIDVPPRVGLRRIQKGRNEEPNLFEKEEALKSVAEVFKTIEENYIVRIDGVDDPDAIHSKIKNVIDAIIDHYIRRHEQYKLFNNQAC